MATELAKILEMLQERSERGRNLVFRHVADLFLSGKIPGSADDRAALVEILKILRPKIDISLRRELSGHLYSMDHPPSDLLEILLEDEDEVSGPLLDYAVIPEHIMARLIDSTPIEVISRLKRRRDLPEDIRARLDERFADRQPPQPAKPTARPQAVKSAHAGGHSRDKEAPTARPSPPAKPERAPAVTSTVTPRPSNQNPYYANVAALDGAARAVAGQRAELRDFIRASSDWQWETDRNGRVTYLSDGAARALGRPVAALLEQPLTEVLAGAVDHHRDAAIDHVLDRRSAFDDLDIATRGFDGSCAWKLAAVPVFDFDSGRFQGYRGIAEAAVNTGSIPAAANSNTPASTSMADEDGPAFDRGVAETIQGLSHELRTPLNAILGFSEMIQLETWGEINADYRRCVDSIIEAARQLNELISDILENAKLRARGDELYPKSFSISSAIEESISLVAAQAKRRNITIETPSRGLRAIVYSDPRMVQYSLVRLLRCALEDSAEGNAVRLSLSSAEDGGMDIHIAFQGRHATTPDSRLSALSRFRINLARELATAVGAEALEKVTGLDHLLTLRLPPHHRFPSPSP